MWNVSLTLGRRAMLEHAKSASDWVEKSLLRGDNNKLKPGLGTKEKLNSCTIECSDLNQKFYCSSNIFFSLFLFDKFSVLPQKLVAKWTNLSKTIFLLIHASLLSSSCCSYIVHQTFHCLRIKTFRCREQINFNPSSTISISANYANFSSYFLEHKFT